MKYLRKYNESISTTSSEDEIRKLLELELEDIPYAEGFEIKTIDVDTDAKRINSFPIVGLFGEDYKVTGFSVAFIEDFRNHAGIMQVFKHDEHTGKKFSFRDKSNHISRSRQIEASNIVADINKKIFDKLSRKYDFKIENWVVDNMYDYIPIEGSVDFEVSFNIVPNESVNESVEVDVNDIKKILEINLEDLPVDNILVNQNVEYNEFSQRVFRYDVRFEADLSENEEVAKYCRISRDTWAIFIRDANNKLAKEAALDIYKARIDRLSKKYDFIASNWVIDIDSNVSPQGWFRLQFTLEPLNISAFK